MITSRLEPTKRFINIFRSSIFEIKPIKKTSHITVLSGSMLYQTEIFSTLLCINICLFGSQRAAVDTRRKKLCRLTPYFKQSRFRRNKKIALKGCLVGVAGTIIKVLLLHIC